jgi:hypothetical protein
MTDLGLFGCPYRATSISGPFLLPGPFDISATLFHKTVGNMRCGTNIKGKQPGRRKGPDIDPNPVSGNPLHGLQLTT